MADEVILEMLTKADEKIKAARLLYDNGIYDDSASRSYYAVYHVICAILYTRTLVFSSHKETIGAFNREFVRTGVFPKEFTVLIEKLFRSRQTGDYDTKQYIDQETAKDRLDAAVLIVNACREYIEQA